MKHYDTVSAASDSSTVSLFVPTIERFSNTDEAIPKMTEWTRNSIPSLDRKVGSPPGGGRNISPYDISENGWLISSSSVGKSMSVRW